MKSMDLKETTEVESDFNVSEYKEFLYTKETEFLVEYVNHNNLIIDILNSMKSFHGLEADLKKEHVVKINKIIGDCLDNIKVPSKGDF